jgi:hypothetical protein
MSVNSVVVAITVAIGPEQPGPAPFSLDPSAAASHFLPESGMVLPQDLCTCGSSTWNIFPLFKDHLSFLSFFILLLPLLLFLLQGLDT